MRENDFLIHSNSLPPDGSGDLLNLPRDDVGWEWMSFLVRRLAAGQVWEAPATQEETGLVVLGGRCQADWGDGKKPLGERDHVFAGLPYTLYLPPGAGVRLEAVTACEIAVCRVPADSGHEPKIITPEDVVVSLRGGGNASRQIVDIIPPSFPAEKLIVVEVYTPSGNWSSFPPHKHDVHDLPAEADLDEIYYYRMESPAGYAHQRLYTPDGKRDLTLTIHDGDTVLIRDGYHPVVAGHGYNVYYLNFIAGSAHTLACSDDPQHAWVRSTWEDMDPRLPLVGSNSARK